MHKNHHLDGVVGGEAAEPLLRAALSCADLGQPGVVVGKEVEQEEKEQKQEEKPRLGDHGEVRHLRHRHHIGPVRFGEIHK